jgi:hypothetical protein
MPIPSSTLEAIAQKFESAVCPEDIFGQLAGLIASKQTALKALTRDLTRTCHPDQAAPQDKALATRLFQSLALWENMARLKIEDGTYGDFKPYQPPAPPYNPVELQVRGKSLQLTGLIAEGTFASVHHARFEGANSGEVFVKYARDPRDNDLLEREYRVLTAFHQPAPDARVEGFLANQRVYVPTPLSTFSILDEEGIKHRANVLAVPQGRSFTAATLLRDKYHDGIEPKHVWWIFRRLLLTLWMAHLKGYVHGAVTPDHVLIYPEEHGIVLLDWTCAAKTGHEHVPALNPIYDAFYPPEVRRKQPATPATDLFMAASTAIFMLGGDPKTHDIPASVPLLLQKSLLSCLAPVASHRPQDAELFHNDFGTLLGKRQYAEMLVP